MRKRTVLCSIIKEVEYAVMILDELYQESPLSAAALSTRRNIPSPFIYRVLKKLEARISWRSGAARRADTPLKPTVKS